MGHLFHAKVFVNFLHLFTNRKQSDWIVIVFEACSAPSLRQKIDGCFNENVATDATHLFCFSNGDYWHYEYVRCALNVSASRDFPSNEMNDKNVFFWSTKNCFRQRESIYVAISSGRKKSSLGMKSLSAFVVRPLMFQFPAPCVQRWLFWHHTQPKWM